MGVEEFDVEEMEVIEEGELLEEEDLFTLLLVGGEGGDATKHLP